MVSGRPAAGGRAARAARRVIGAHQVHFGDQQQRQEHQWQTTARAFVSLAHSNFDYKTLFNRIATEIHQRIPLRTFSISETSISKHVRRRVAPTEARTRRCICRTAEKRSSNAVERLSKVIRIDRTGETINKCASNISPGAIGSLFSVQHPRTRTLICVRNEYIEAMALESRLPLNRSLFPLSLRSQLRSSNFAAFSPHSSAPSSQRTVNISTENLFISL